MIRRCTERDFEAVFEVINSAARAYRGVIAPDCWHEPYMSRAELQRQIDTGVAFWGLEQEGELVGVMGLQDRGEVALIRHAYVRPSCQRQGVGRQLLQHLESLSETPLLVGTWADATWAVRFYEKHGFRLVTPAEKDRLLQTYWQIPARQVETSVVLADQKWFYLLQAK